MTYIETVKFYSTCQAPTERELRQKRLGMCDEEFELYELFNEGKSTEWLIII